MKILVIPDVHLKPWIFSKADEVLKNGGAERAVCLMDIADDWDMEENLALYRETFDTAISFAKRFPKTIWCRGNHDFSYLWGRRHSGYSDSASTLVQVKVTELQETVGDNRNMLFVAKIDDVLFSHGGIAASFVKSIVPQRYRMDLDAVAEYINYRGSEYNMWTATSPLLYRPQYYSAFPGGPWTRDRAHNIRPYRPQDVLQVVGHTSVLISGKSGIIKNGNIISCDTFSTDRGRTMNGGNCFAVIDTKTWEYSELAA